MDRLEIGKTHCAEGKKPTLRRNKAIISGSEIPEVTISQHWLPPLCEGLLSPEPVASWMSGSHLRHCSTNDIPRHPSYGAKVHSEPGIWKSTNLGWSWPEGELTGIMRWECYLLLLWPGVYKGASFSPGGAIADTFADCMIDTLCCSSNNELGSTSLPLVKW